LSGSTRSEAAAGTALSFRERLTASCQVRDSHLCVGLDPDLDLLPSGFHADHDDVLRFVTAIIEATAEFAAAYKPNSAFYEVMGPAGMEVLQAVIASVPADTPVILDAKRGDISYTNERYARAAFEVFGAGAVTVSPYLGRESIETFTDYQDRGVFVLCRTSNPGAADVQDIEVGGRPLFLEIARLCKEWDRNRNIGLVVGATWPEQLAAVRAEVPEMPILVPGAGAQGGDVEASARAAGGSAGDAPFVLSSSRSVMHAGRDHDFQHAAADAARKLRDQIRSAS
jgi:orotidine-5'-phosphate decarboxylase